VRLSFFGHLERSNSLRDGDKPGIFFSEVNVTVCLIFLWRKLEVNATMNTRSVNRVGRRLWGEEGKKEYFSEVNATRNLQCKPFQAAAMRRGNKVKKRREYFSEVNLTMNFAV
jgi:hypothetical protein